MQRTLHGRKVLMLQALRQVGHAGRQVRHKFRDDFGHVRVIREFAANLGIRLERPESLNGSATLARAIADLAARGLARVASACSASS